MRIAIDIVPNNRLGAVVITSTHKYQPNAFHFYRDHFYHKYQPNAYHFYRDES